MASVDIRVTKIKGNLTGIRELQFQPKVLDDLQRRATRLSTAAGARVMPLEGRGTWTRRPRVAVVGPINRLRTHLGALR